MVQDLREAWRTVAPIEFAVQKIEKEPHFLQLLAASEAVVAIGIDIRLGNCGGPLNLAIPSLIIKTMHQKLDQHWTTRRTEPSVAEQRRMMHLVSAAESEIDVVIDAPGLPARALAGLKPGDVLLLERSIDSLVTCRINGTDRFYGRMVQCGRKRAVVIEHSVEKAGAA